MVRKRFLKSDPRIANIKGALSIKNRAYIREKLHKKRTNRTGPPFQLTGFSIEKGEHQHKTNGDRLKPPHSTLHSMIVTVQFNLLAKWTGDG